MMLKRAAAASMSNTNPRLWNRILARIAAVSLSVLLSSQLSAQDGTPSAKDAGTTPATETAPAKPAPVTATEPATAEPDPGKAVVNEPDPGKSAVLDAAPIAGLNSLKFRSGVITAAELTTKNIPIKNVSPYASPQQHKPAEQREDSGAQYAFAVVTVKLDPGRSIGMYDYVLSDDANDFPCYAIAKNDDEFDFDQWDVRDPAPNDSYRLLYEVLLPISENVKIQYGFKFKLLPTMDKPLTIPFSNNGDKGPTPVAKIPAAGILPIDSPSAPVLPPPPDKKGKKGEKDEPTEKTAVPDDIGASIPDSKP
jgi:hypothetical protein